MKPENLPDIYVKFVEDDVGGECLYRFTVQKKIGECWNDVMGSNYRDSLTQLLDLAKELVPHIEWLENLYDSDWGWNIVENAENI